MFFFTQSCERQNGNIKNQRNSNELNKGAVVRVTIRDSQQSLIHRLIASHKIEYFELKLWASSHKRYIVTGGIVSVLWFPIASPNKVFIISSC